MKTYNQFINEGSIFNLYSYGKKSENSLTDDEIFLIINDILQLYRSKLNSNVNLYSPLELIPRSIYNRYKNKLIINLKIRKILEIPDDETIYKQMDIIEKILSEKYDFKTKSILVKKGEMLPQSNNVQIKLTIENIKKEFITLQRDFDIFSD